MIIKKSHFYDSSYSTALSFANLKVGIPVRYRDYVTLSQRISVPYYEFHLTKGDLSFNDFNDLILCSGTTYGAHAPDIYDSNVIFDPFSEDSSKASLSNLFFEQLLEHVSQPFDQFINLIHLKLTMLVTSFSFTVKILSPTKCRFISSNRRLYQF